MGKIVLICCVLVLSAFSGWWIIDLGATHFSSETRKQPKEWSRQIKEYETFAVRSCANINHDDCIKKYWEAKEEGKIGEFKTPRLVRQQVSPRCEGRPLQFKMEKTLLSLPRDVKGLYYRNGRVGDSKQESPKLKEIYKEKYLEWCGDNPPIEVKYFSYMPGKYFPLGGEGEKADVSIVQLKVYLVDSEQDRGDTLFRKIIDALEKDSRSLYDLPVEEGFYVFDGVVAGELGASVRYVPTDDSFLSLDGTPVIFTCRKRAAVPDCGIGVTKESIRYSAKMRNMPKSAWREFYDEFLRYIDQLKVIADAPIGHEQEN